MTVVYRCAEDGTLCAAECQSIYIDVNEQEGTVHLNISAGSDRYCEHFLTDDYEDILLGMARNGNAVADFSAFSFKSGYDEDGNLLD